MTDIPSGKCARQAPAVSPPSSEERVSSDAPEALEPAGVLVLATLRDEHTVMFNHFFACADCGWRGEPAIAPCYLPRREWEEDDVDLFDGWHVLVDDVRWWLDLPEDDPLMRGWR